eukprot:4959002-Prymnesium_polylepis.1
MSHSFLTAAGRRAHDAAALRRVDVALLRGNVALHRDCALPSLVALPRELLDGIAAALAPGLEAAMSFASVSRLARDVIAEGCRFWELTTLTHFPFLAEWAQQQLKPRD